MKSSRATSVSVQCKVQNCWVRWNLDSNYNIHTLHVAPFWHWPWQLLMSEEEKTWLIWRTVSIQEFILGNFFTLLGAIYTEGCAQPKFWKEITSEAKRVPDRPWIDCNWACTGSTEELSMQVQSWWQSWSFNLPRWEKRVTTCRKSEWS